MDPQSHPPPPGEPSAAAAGTCACDCRCCGRASLDSDAWVPSLKRRMDEMEAATPSISPAAVDDGVVRVEIADEAAAVCGHLQSIQELRTELEEERSAAASAASEAMSMILRLQREKAEVQMEARQFKGFAEEKMAHDRQEIAALEDLLLKYDETILSLSYEVETYRHRLFSSGIGVSDAPASEPESPDEATTADAQFDFSCGDYPPLRSTLSADDATIDIYKYPFGETPREHLNKLEARISQLERMPSCGQMSNVVDKMVAMGHSPHRPIHIKRLSVDSCGSSLEFNKGEEFPITMDLSSDCGVQDDMSDRVYTIDTMHKAAEDYVSLARVVHNEKDTNGSDEEAEIRKLRLRLEALEADRESMRKTLISIATDKTQVVMLNDIAQHLREDASSEKIVKKQPFLKRFSLMLIIKAAVSFVFRRKRSSRIRYSFGLSANNAGLLLLLDRAARMRHQRFFTKTQGELPTFHTRPKSSSQHVNS
ncbi:unnamed protein product [Musa acuminata subsp. malaccensis]|uniref:(wild Malaysian banana) hypothetical protein n=1 Tax=Musa acuminata subsp. malaccensis TaxID=214687 RepID=A0A804J2B5_MUSAM|nr:unnamed protein product [Musa acuminata subsp. malaccensis]